MNNERRYVLCPHCGKKLFRIIGTSVYIDVFVWCKTCKKEIKVTKKTLNDSNLIYNDLKNKCDAYVIISSEKNIATEDYEIMYLPYIKCSWRYMTSNYSEY